LKEPIGFVPIGFSNGNREELEERERKADDGGGGWSPRMENEENDACRLVRKSCAPAH